MDPLNHKIDRSLKNVADKLKVEPRNESWDRLEPLLPKTHQRIFTRPRLMIAAVILPLTVLTIGGIYTSNVFLKNDVIEISNTEADKYYTDYLVFLKSESYSDLQLAYRTQD